MRPLQLLRTMIGLLGIGVALLFVLSFVRGPWVGMYGEEWFLCRGAFVTGSYNVPSSTAWQWSYDLLPPSQLQAGIDWYVNMLPAEDADSVVPWLWPYRNDPTTAGRAAFSSRVLFVPLWMPLAALAGAWGLLWWLLPPKFAAGHCRKCGYDVRTLAAGARCPECGEEGEARRDDGKAQRHEGTQVRSGA